MGDTSGPVGTWYLNADGVEFSAVIEPGVAPGTFSGTSIHDAGARAALDEIAWDASSRLLEFRLNGQGFTEWYRAGVVEGILVGRFSHHLHSTARPNDIAAYTAHVSGWNSDYLDDDITPRVYEVLMNEQYKARLRIDRSGEGSASFIGRFKVYAGPQDEENEYDLEVSQWDGTRLAFIRRNPNWAQTFTGVASGRTIAGTFLMTGERDPFPWRGSRAEVLTYGLAHKAESTRATWQQRTRSQIAYLLMGGRPTLRSRPVQVLRSDLAPFQGSPPGHRDDDLEHHPQDYRLTELQFDYTLEDPYGGPPVARTSHAYLAVPNSPPPGGKHPAVLALNGHHGSAHNMMDPDEGVYWYGDAFARRNYVVLAVDVSHRPPKDSAPLYDDVSDGDDPSHGNHAHPAIKPPDSFTPGFRTSDWAEDGERAWDAMRALDYLLERPDVDARHVIVTGLSMGGEITTIVGALDPRLAMSIPAGFSPDLGVMLNHGNHPCWRWKNADIREYLDVSDLHALTAPRPLVVLTGRVDGTFSSKPHPFAADKQVLRRARVAYDRIDHVVHYLHYDEHHYHVGDANPHIPEHGVHVPVVIEPTSAFSLDWQNDSQTQVEYPTLFDCIERMIILVPDVAADPPMLAYGDVPVDTPMDLTLRITNPGQAALTVAAFRTSDPHFVVVSPPADLAIPPGSTAPLTVRFTPDGVRSFNAGLSMTTNVPGVGSFGVPLTGTGAIISGVIEGHVRDAAGHPIADASVLVGSTQLSTDSQGFYSVSVAPGVYSVSASQSGLMPSHDTVTVAARGTVVKDFTLAPAAAFTLKGEVTDNRKKPIPGATVRLESAAPLPSILQATTDSRGSYSISENPGSFDGAYTVEVFATGFQVGGETIPQLLSGTTVTKDFALAALGSVIGRVTDAQGAALAGALVLVGKGIPVVGVTRTFGFSANTDSAGRYSIIVDPPGSYNVVAAQSYFEDSDPAQVTVRLDAATGLDFALVRAVPGDIKGVVEESDSQDSIEGATVEVSVNPSSESRSAQTDAAGEYHLSKVLSGRRQVTAASRHHSSDTLTVRVVGGQAVTANFALAATQSGHGSDGGHGRTGPRPE
jgi:dienelactone hydrolase/protocatechuate 3,4-dioxygenase beta subunit